MNKTYLLETLQTLLAIPSPTGFTAQASAFVKKEIERLGFSCLQTYKGAVMAVVPGKKSGARLYASHLDTLGAMVREIRTEGRLKITPVGGLPYPAMEGENVEVHTTSGKRFSGTIMPIKSSIHLFSKEVREEVRTADNMEVRIDEMVKEKEDVQALGIQVGDYVSLDPRTRILDNGLIKSRFLDDKSCCAVLLTILEDLQRRIDPPEHTTYFMFSDYEEVGHGIYRLPQEVQELISVDIGVVGSTQTSELDKVTIFAKDGATPYDYSLKTKLIDLCLKEEISYCVDVIEGYGSDASGAVRQGHDIRIACIGPGVEATHHYERTHIMALENTFNLLLAHMDTPL